MQTLVSIIAALISMNSFALSNDHAHGPHLAKHNMVLIGEEKVYASHIVYKRPHNFQVILELNFPTSVMETYLAEKKSHPNDQFIFLLDSSDISKIQFAESLSGTLLRTDADEVRHELLTGIVIAPGKFKVLYFDELPLSLE